MFFFVCLGIAFFGFIVYKAISSNHEEHKTGANKQKEEMETTIASIDEANQDVKNTKNESMEDFLKSVQKFKVSKYDLCNSCRKIKYPVEETIEGILDSKGYNNSMLPPMFPMINHGILESLEENGGCTNCTSLLRRIIRSFNDHQF